MTHEIDAAIEKHHRARDMLKLIMRRYDDKQLEELDYVAQLIRQRLSGSHRTSKIVVETGSYRDKKYLTIYDMQPAPEIDYGRRQLSQPHRREIFGHSVDRRVERLADFVTPEVTAFLENKFDAARYQDLIESAVGTVIRYLARKESTILRINTMVLGKGYYKKYSIRRLL